MACADTAAREQALDVTRSVILQAPAGSGKTTVLSQRYLKLLANCAEPESVLAITFTRKAAGELRARVLRALKGDTERKTPADELTAALAAAATRRHPGLIESASRLKIMTIDSWNMSLASRLPITSRSNVSLRVVDSVAELYLRAAREALRGAEKDSTLSAALDAVMERLDNDWRRLERLIVAMLADRNHWLPRVTGGADAGDALADAVEASLVSITSDTLRQTAAVMGAALCVEAAEIVAHCAQVLLEEGRELPLGFDAWSTPSARLTSGLDALQSWRGVASLALTKKGTVRTRLDITVGIRTKVPGEKQRVADWLHALGQSAGLQDLLGDIACLPDPTLDEATRAIISDLGTVLFYAAQMLNVLFAETGLCDHIAIAGAARQALTENGQPTDLAERLDLKLQHILIDEFQDTSREQFQLLEAMVAGWSPDDGKTLFLVGDPMQSIYQFRNAEVGLFMRAREQGVGDIELLSLQLRRNFRSAHKLVDQANEWFAACFPAADDMRFGAIRHLASEPAAVGRGDSLVELHYVASNGRRREAEHVGALIASLRQTNPGESIAVLAASRTHTLLIAEQLRTAGIAYTGVKLTPLIETPVIRDLEALTRVLLSRGDRTAWFAVMRAPWCGLSLLDLTRIAATRLDESAADLPTVLRQLQGAVASCSLSDDGLARAARTLQILEGCLADAGRRPLAEWVESAWLRLDGPASCYTADELANARVFFTALQAYDSERGTLSGADIELQLADLYAPSDSPGRDAVVVTTIYQAKGLEYDHVILPGLGRVTQSDQEPLLRWLELPRVDRDSQPDATDLLVAPIKRLGDESEPLAKLIKRFASRRAELEQSRLLYVALTRARRSLHLYMHPKSDKEQQLAARTRTLLKPIWPAVSAAFAQRAPLVDDGLETVGTARKVNMLRRLSMDRERASAPLDVVRVPLEVGSLEDSLEYRWASETARQIGTAVHAALEAIAAQAALDDPAAVAHIRSQLRLSLIGMGVPEGELADAAARAETALDNTLQDGKGRWILSADHREAASELALSGVEAQRVVSVVIDRTFVDADGTRWVVDFKTSPHEGGSVEHFLDEQTERYRPQLTRYARLLHKLKGGPVRAGLYFPLLKEWRECVLAPLATESNR